MNLKELIKEVETLKRNEKDFKNTLGIAVTESLLQGIKQTVEAVDIFMYNYFISKDDEDNRDWQKLKKLLGIK